MNKKFKVVGCAMALAMGLTMLGGCGKKSDEKILESMVDKYAAMCTLGEYKGVEYVEVKTEVTDEMIQYQVDSLLSQYAVSETLTEGTAEDGDTVNIDFVGSIDGVEFEGGSSGGAGYELTLGSGTMIEGFEEAIVGHDVGETFDIDVTFPDNYGSADLAGQDAVFEITINSIVTQTVPEYTDEFVASNTDYSTIAEYEASIKDTLTQNSTLSDENYNKSAVITNVISAATINEYPQEEMKKLIDDSIANVEDEASSYGYDLGTYVIAAYGMSSEEAFRQYISTLVEDYMKEKIVVCAVAKAEGITVNEDEIAEYKKKMMDSYGITDEEKLYDYYEEEDVIYYALADKVVAFLLENGVPTEATNTDATAE